MGRFTDEVEKLRAIDRLKHPPWRQIPLTIGLLVALIAAVAFIWHLAYSYREDQLRSIHRSIDSHNQSTGAHADIRDNVRELRRQLKEAREETRKEVHNLRFERGRRSRR